MTSSWTAQLLLASPRPPCSAAERHPSDRGDGRWIVALGPRWVRAAAVRARASAGTNGRQGSEDPQVAGPISAAEMMQVGDSDCGPEGQRSAPSGSRRAATGVRNNRRACSETVEDHDRRSWHRRPLTWRSSHAFTVLNTTQVHVRRPGADLARRKPGGVKSPHLHPPQPAGHPPGGSHTLGRGRSSIPLRTASQAFASPQADHREVTGTLPISPGSSDPVEFTAVFGVVVAQQPAVAARRQACSSEDS